MTFSSKSAVYAVITAAVSLSILSGPSLAAPKNASARAHASAPVTGERIVAPADRVNWYVAH